MSEENENEQVDPHTRDDQEFATSNQGGTMRDGKFFTHDTSSNVTSGTEAKDPGVDNRVLDKSRQQGATGGQRGTAGHAAPKSGDYGATGGEGISSRSDHDSDGTPDQHAKGSGNRARGSGESAGFDRE